MNFSSTNSEEKSMADNLSSSYEQVKQKREALSYHQNNMEQAQTTYDRMDSTRISSSTNDYDNMMNYISERLDPKSNNRIGLNKARQIIDAGGKDYEHYVEKYNHRNAMRMVNSTNFDQQYNDIKSSKLNYKDTANAVDSLIIGNKVESDRSKIQNEHFKDFKVESEPIKQEFDTRSKAAEEKIEDQKMKTNEVGKEIKGKVDVAEELRGTIFNGKIKTIKFGKDNTNKGEWNDE